MKPELKNLPTGRTEPIGALKPDRPVLAVSRHFQRGVHLAVVVPHRVDR